MNDTYEGIDEMINHFEKTEEGKSIKKRKESSNESPVKIKMSRTMHLDENNEEYKLTYDCQNTTTTGSLLDYNEKGPECYNENIDIPSRGLQNIEDIDFDIDNLLMDKKQVMRRRSSFGRYLSKPQVPLPEMEVKGEIHQGSVLSEATEVMTTVHSTAVTSSLLDDHATIQDAISSTSKQDQGQAEMAPELDLINSAHANIYRIRTEQLTKEYKSWKSLLKKRSKELEQSKREYSEVKNDHVVITKDEIMPYLSVKKKNFLASRPDYNQCFQQIRFSNEKSQLLSKESERTLGVYSKFLEVCGAVSQACYVKIENEFLGDLKEKDVKDIMKSLKELSCTETRDGTIV